MKNTNIKTCELVGFVLVKKLISLIDMLKTSLQQKANYY
jgi:hypothetical protein